MAAARARRLLVCALGAGLLILCGSAPQPASARVGRPAPERLERPAPVGSDRFVRGSYYHGDFPDPAVLRWGRTSYAYATTIASLNLPVVVSTDLVHWRVVGEGLRRPAKWAVQRRIGKGQFATTWAPTVSRFGNHFVHAYATRVRGAKDHRMCISYATSRHPWGGFVDRTTRPWVCPTSRGAIDPQFFTAPGGAQYLLWKSEQTRVAEAQIWITPLSADGTHFLAPSRRLLTVQDPWERGIIENPSMTAYAGRYYLFYSGGSYADPTYATGYATCSTALGPCTRVGSRPLLATGGRVAGPGGASAFRDSVGRLRLAYAAWDFGNSGYPRSSACLRSPHGCPQRRLHVATLAANPDVPGALVVTGRG